jgi:NTP pyrophosphatase (non-canonical NTP hydrolase)
MLNDLQTSALRVVQSKCRHTAIYPNKGFPEGKMYCALGLAGEAGEVCENIKKMIRNDDGKLNPKRRSELMMELGDVIWYVANMAVELDAGLDECVEMMLGKLEQRQLDGALKHE